MTWYARSWQHMTEVHQQAEAEGKFAHCIAKAIDDSYPFGERSGWPYKAWLDARREYFRKHDLPRPRAKVPGQGQKLLWEMQREH